MSSTEQLPYQGITLYSHPDDHYSHRIRMVLAEKQLPHQLLYLDAADDDLAQLNPYGTLPMLVDHQIKLFHGPSIAEYLDERYRQNQLYGDTPVARAEQRQLLWRIEQDWFRLFDIILRHPDSLDRAAQQQAQQELHDILLSLMPLFGHAPFFLSEYFSILDCSLAALFYRIPQLGLTIDAKQGKNLMLYCQRLFHRESFKRALSEIEMRRYAQVLQWFSHPSKVYNRL